MSPTTLNFWTFLAGCIILAWAIRAAFRYSHEMKEMVADIWWNSEKAVMLEKVKEAERLTAADRPIDIWTLRTGLEIRRLIKEIEQGPK